MGIKDFMGEEAMQQAQRALESMADEAPPAEPGKGEDGAPEARPADKDPPKPRTMTVRWRNKELDLPEDEVVRLASQGVDYSQKMAALKAEREAIEKEKADASLVGDFKQYREYLAANPQLAAAIAEMTRTYDEKRIVPKLAWEDGTPAPTTDQDLRDRLHQLEAELARQAKARRETVLDEAALAAVGSRPVFAASPSAAAVAAKKLAAMLREDPTMTPEAGALVVEEEAKRWLNTLGASAITADQDRRKQDDKVRHGVTERPGVLPAGQVNPPSAEFTIEDYRSGRVRRAAEAFLRGGGSE